MNIEHAVRVVLLLAALAAITERLVELLKTCKHPWCPGGLFEAWKRRYGGSSSEYAQRMAFITVLVSVLVAWVLGTDLLVVLTKESTEWLPNPAPSLTLSRCLGLLAAGLAVSVGARTWHDIAEHIMLAKNAKRRFVAGDETDAGLAHDDRREEAEASAALHRDRWFREYSELTGVSVGYKEIDGVEGDQLAILFEVERKLSSPGKELPRCVEYGGRLIPTDVIATGRTAVADYRHNASGPLFAGALPVELGFGTFRKDHAGVIGTLGLRVKRANTTFALTCMHVACPGELSRGVNNMARGAASGPMFAAKAGPPALPIGMVTEARFDSTRGFDLALVKVVEASVADRIEGRPSAPSGIRQVSPRHARVRLPVELCGFTSRHQRGRLLARDVSQRIHYTQGPVVMHNLIRCSRIAAPGDSGAAVIDRDGKVLGLVVATNSRFSFLMPIAPALGAFDVALDIAG